MRERAEMWLKIGCGALVAVLLFQTVHALLRNRPFAHTVIPAVPRLAADTNAPPAAVEVAVNPETALLVSLATNAPGGTNRSGTNLRASVSATNFPANTNHGTNLPPVLVAGTVATNHAGMTNTLAPKNALALKPATGGTNSGVPVTNEIAATPTKRTHHANSPMMGGMFLPGMGGPGKPLPPLSGVEQARIDKIVQSEIFGPIPHPLPMGLLGIAGDTAFLRSASGQTGLVKVGDTLDDLKLLRIGINRVLLEQNGQKKELTIFDGMGSESLLTTSDKNSNETTQH